MDAPRGTGIPLVESTNMLASFYDGHVDKKETMKALRNHLKTSPSPSSGPELMVTHYVVIKELTGRAVSSGGAVLFDPEMEPGLRSTSTSTGTTAGTAGTVRAVTGSTQGGVSLGANDLESAEDTTTSSAGETEQGLAEVDNTGLKESSSTRKFLALVGVAVMCRFQ